MGSLVKTHKGAVLYGAQDLRIEDCITTTPEDHQVQIRVRATGICGTDMHYFQNGRNGIYVVKEPLILGHEAAGEISAVGKNVTEFKIGDRVLMEPQRPCEKCVVCRRGRYNLCDRMKFSGSASCYPVVQGSLQQFYNHAASFVYRLPDNVSFVEGALVEPLAVALHAVRRSGVETGQSVLILGAGAVGLLCAGAAKIAGASSVNIVDIDEGKLNFALGESRTDFAARIADETLAQPGFGLVDVVFECTGADTCMNIAIQCATKGGKVVMVGLGTPVQSLNIGLAGVHEVDLLGIWRYANTFPTAIELLRTGQIDLKPMITHTFDLEKAADSLKFTLSRPDNLVKCVITCK
ncbi:GroES-like protein [Hyaloscypha bicolor E]|uniref:GroES-like protein n=1 Tax=Hyaloscypha bicolor E TaxID=1095630 RepID=A0A2J6SQ06_9HELO|nr:GroES-like protein [Hyaloscypha bicolor E]PMD52827.1 GroES-like protein [Hyaloscypha bicolor E]